jgi:uridine kinase
MKTPPCLVIGIAGGTASGKTTIAHALTQELGPERATLISHDLYYRPPPPHADMSQYNFDEPSALDNDKLAAQLQALQRGEVVQLPEYDFTTHASRPGLPCEPSPILVVEGILIFACPALRAQMHHRVYVHTPEDVRLHRRLLRDQADRGRSVEDILHQYFDTVRPMHQKYVEPSRGYCTLTLNGQQSVSDSVGQLLELLDPVHRRAT